LRTAENTSYGLTLCAERNALSSAAADGNKSGLSAIAVYSPNKTMCIPCGACLQWMAEFCAPNKDVKIILEDEDGNAKVFMLSEFLPFCFKLEK